MANKWFAGVLGFFSAPCAFIYLGRFWIAAAYLFLLILAYLADLYLSSTTVVPFAGLLIAIIAAVHAFGIAKTIDFAVGRKWYNYWWGVLLIPVTFFALTFLTRSFIAEPYSIPSASMSPSVEMGDYILVKKWGYGSYGAFGITLVNLHVEKRIPLERGEIAVVIPPHTPTPFLERIIGLPGDTVEFNNKQLIINGAPVKTELLTGVVARETMGEHVFTVKYLNEQSKLRTGKWVVPNNHYFVMGDNRDNSADSRVWGMVHAENVVGRLWAKW
jgi:signal peptidase I